MHMDIPHKVISLAHVATSLETPVHAFHAMCRILSYHRHPNHCTPLDGVSFLVRRRQMVTRRVGGSVPGSGSAEIVISQPVSCSSLVNTVPR